MYTSILVPLDGSSFSEHALPLALDLARRSGATLHLVHVVDAGGSQRGVPSAWEHAQRYLVKVAEQLRTVWPVRVETTLLDGQVDLSIAAYADAHQSDLAVITTHGRGAFSRAWLGSVADRLIRRLPSPVLLIRPHLYDAMHIQYPPRIEHMLLPLDGTHLSERIIPQALALGRLTGARYTLIQVLEMLVPFYGPEIMVPSEQITATLTRDAQCYLERIAGRLRLEGFQAHTELLIGPSAETILQYARDHAVDLIALQSQGRSGAARLFIGSVADKIVRGADAPVLLHRSHVLSAPRL
jgi:nucleotide-binding universal stress UspA family protein